MYFSSLTIRENFYLGQLSLANEKYIKALSSLDDTINTSSDKIEGVPMVAGSEGRSDFEGSWLVESRILMDGGKKLSPLTEISEIDSGGEGSCKCQEILKSISFSSEGEFPIFDPLQSHLEGGEVDLCLVQKVSATIMGKRSCYANNFLWYCEF